MAAHERGHGVSVALVSDEQLALDEPPVVELRTSRAAVYRRLLAVIPQESVVARDERGRQVRPRRSRS